LQGTLKIETHISILKSKTTVHCLDLQPAMQGDSARMQ